MGKPVLGKYFVNTAQMAEILGVSPRALREWTQLKGCPKAGENRYDVAAVYAWASDSMETKNDTVQLRYALLKAQAENIRLTARATAKDLLRRDAATEVHQTTQQAAIDALERMGARLAASPKWAPYRSLLAAEISDAIDSIGSHQPDWLAEADVVDDSDEDDA